MAFEPLSCKHVINAKMATFRRVGVPFIKIVGFNSFATSLI
jgi:hypothetical protein